MTSYIKREPCGVTFTILVPHDISTTPYILLHSKGEHKHPPPLLSKIPITLQSEINDLVVKSVNKKITASKCSILV